MHHLKRQQGLSFWGWLFVLFSLGCFFAVGIQIAPLYMEHATARNIIMGLTDDVIASHSRQKIRKSIVKRMIINGAQLPNKAIKINIKGKNVKIILDYERRKNIVYNVDVVIVFNETFEFNK